MDGRTTTEGGRMSREHDKWSKMGEGNLGEMNIRWAEMRAHGIPDSFENEKEVMGFFTLMKCILNDHWADAPRQIEWDTAHIDYVMSKLYYCWVRMLWGFYPEDEEE